MRTNILCIFMVLCFTFSFSQSIPDKNYDRKNAFYVQNFIVIPCIYYDRTIPLTSTFFLVPRGGLGIYEDGVIPIVGASVGIGSRKHKVEVGTAYWALEGFLINVNYRYNSRKGFLLKFGLEYIPGEEGNPIIGIGYAF